MAWLLGWLVLGLLASREFGALAMSAGGGGDVLALVCVVGSIACFCVLAVSAVRRARPGGLLALVLICAAGLAACLGILLFSGLQESWVAGVLFGAAYCGLCLLAGGVAAIMAWRRKRAEQARHEQVRADRERQRRMEGIRAETAAFAATAAAHAQNDTLGPDSDFTLPSRPKWEES